MKWLKTIIIYLLLAISFSLTFDLSQTENSQSPTILIFRKSKPSILIFPSNETITLNYPKQREFTKILLGKKEPTIKFGKLKRKQQNQQEVKQTKKKKKKNSTKKVTQTQKQTVPDKQEPVKPKAVEKETAKTSSQPPTPSTMVGTFKLLHAEQFGNPQMDTIKFNATHISYTICSTNTCKYSQVDGAIQFGACELKPRSDCKPFDELFYGDMRFLAQLQLVQSFKNEGGKFKFYDKQPFMRLELEKVR